MCVGQSRSGSSLQHHCATVIALCPAVQCCVRLYCVVMCCRQVMADLTRCDLSVGPRPPTVQACDAGPCPTMCVHGGLP